MLDKRTQGGNHNSLQLYEWWFLIIFLCQLTMMSLSWHGIILTIQPIRRSIKCNGRVNVIVNDTPLTLWSWKMQLKYWLGHFQTHTNYRCLGHIMWSRLQIDAAKPHRWFVNISSSDGLMPSGNKPLPEPILIQIYVAMLRLWATTN